jgi:hypothetical protein
LASPVNVARQHSTAPGPTAERPISWEIVDALPHCPSETH